MRDGIDVANIDALSYYDNTVEPGTTYEFTLQRTAPLLNRVILPDLLLVNVGRI